VVLRHCTARWYGFVLFLTLGSVLSAAPRLSLTQTAFTVSVATGSNGATQTLDAANLGDGSLTLQLSSSVTWLAATTGQSHACASGGVCIPIQIAVQSSTLAKGTYTGTVTVSDPNAVDAPQFITVTLFAGGNVPDKLDFFLPPGSSATSDFITAGPSTATVNSAPWLSIAVNGVGTFRFNVPYRVTATASNGMGLGDYNGSITINGSSLAADNKTIPSVLHVTTQPILRLSSGAVQFRIAQSANKQTTFVGVANGGQGTLTVSNVTATAASGTWLTAQTASGGALVSITADPTGLTPNTYQGTVTVASNAVNGNATIPVQLTVVAQTAPVVFAGGVVNNGTFGGGESVALGDIVAVFGDQFTFGDPQQAASLPLQTILGGTQVLVNGTAAPVYYVSPGQINFEIPINALAGDSIVRVVRNGQQGNQAFVKITDRVPRFILLNGGPYAIMTTPAGDLTGIPGHPVKGGDVIVIYTIGLGPSSPIVASGTASPSSPPAVVSGETKVCFGSDSPFAAAPCATPAFVGLTPGFVGLYQINVTIPFGLPSGDSAFSFKVNDVPSNVVQLAIQ
jgi:uncharacterized protein (TIGR03437 family)